MPIPLIIVESPAKATAIAHFLGEKYKILASVGHIADLPGRELGVQVHNNFTPTYVLTERGAEVIQRLQAALDNASALYIATDDDREGEAIAADLIRYLRTDLVPQRMVFQEITAEAIQHAINNPRALDNDLVQAAVARRILDRLYGYSISPLLWNIVSPGLSAGRVQSPAIRFIVEREQERMGHGSAGYWHLNAITQGANPFKAKLLSVDGLRLAKGNDFTDDGEIRSGIRNQVVVATETWINTIVSEIGEVKLNVREITNSQKTMHPKAPYITSTLLQDAANKLGMSAKSVTQTLQFLYNPIGNAQDGDQQDCEHAVQGGFVTYPRTDNVSIPLEEINAIRAVISATHSYGPQFLSPTPRHYTPAPNAQSDKHAIRPTNPSQNPEAVREQLTQRQYALYQLIWQRTLASQMADHVTDTLTVHLDCLTASTIPRRCSWSASETTVIEQGYRRAYEEARDENVEGENDDTTTNRLATLSVNDAIGIDSLHPTVHVTLPKARYTESTLLKALEDSGIGRPSTYSKIMERISETGYVRTVGRALVPTWYAFSAIKLLKEHFANLIDLEFTSQLETRLDDVARGLCDQQTLLREFYFGTPAQSNGLQELLRCAINDADGASINCHRIGTHPTTGEEINVHIGRFGPYVRSGDTNRRIAKFMAPDEMTVDRATAMLDGPGGGAWRPQ